MTETDLAWAAGIVDGEGSIVIESATNSRKCHVLRVIVANTDPRMPLALRALFGGTVLPTKKQQAHHRQAWSWVVSTAQAHAVLVAIRPYLICKAEQADLGIEFGTTKRKAGQFRLPPGTTEYRESLRDQLKVLRHKEAI
jgi:hypothetical protein